MAARRVDQVRPRSDQRRAATSAGLDVQGPPHCWYTALAHSLWNRIGLPGIQSVFTSLPY
ncbi:MAG TPA: hypothetical protein VNN74_05610 [Candidatus Micrarchaeia archaeon]|nr:hypothetical protein [Candidatus Micrarchaeia archaeon]